ncbi:hypothetical protein, conserved [Eimeria maxima]|uniref:Uncharacterized protein n=1 Tax=Eimeria maxima TaxID=5804 RepID=U6LWL9_EIMMA|nr:hypothetical protein, conserved [Eimeria maxima]CDJ56357.1 hypothetical protein, conserved [Eimeria maxima]
MLGLRQAVSSLQLTVDRSSNRYVQQQQQICVSSAHSSTSNSSKGHWEQQFVFPRSLTDLRGLDVSHLLLQQQDDQLPVFDAVAALVLQQLRLQNGLLRLLPSVSSPAARQAQNMYMDSSCMQLNSSIQPNSSGSSSSGGLFGSRWSAAAAAESAAMQQLLLESPNPQLAVAAAVAAAATAAEALTGWLCVLSALGKGFGVVGSQVAVQLSRELGLLSILYVAVL